MYQQNRRPFDLALLIMCCIGIARPSQAEPFELVAVYRDTLKSSTETEITLEPNQVIPNELAEQTFKSIRIKLKTDEHSKVALADLKDVHIVVESLVNDVRITRPSITMPAKGGAGKADVYFDQVGSSAAAIEGLRLRVQSRLTEDYLCSREIALRNQSKTPVQSEQAKVDFLYSAAATSPSENDSHGTKNKASTKNKTEAQLQQESWSKWLFFQKPIYFTDGRSPVLYSHCESAASMIILIKPSI